MEPCGADFWRLQHAAYANPFERVRATGECLFMALRVIRGTPLNFRSRRTTCPTEVDAGTGEDDPKPSFDETTIDSHLNRDRRAIMTHSPLNAGFPIGTA
jgi:hypothetical protein